MPIEVVLIVGPSNAGKSTLFRCLTGVFRGDMEHPAIRNIVNLTWGPNAASEQTLVLISSLNEGGMYDPKEGEYKPRKRAYTVAPWHLKVLLDLYDQNDKFNCTRAILCINSTVSYPDWTVADYAAAANAIVANGSHTFTHCVSLGATDLIQISNAQPVQAEVAPYPRNHVAAKVRSALGLT